MKRINHISFKTFEKIVSKLENGHVKLGTPEDTFMPVVCEKVGECKSGSLISLAHYYEQNGDLMADPEMVFIYKPGEYALPVSYKNDGLGLSIESVQFTDGEPSHLYKNLQADHAVFAGQWLSNIKLQQNIN